MTLLGHLRDTAADRISLAPDLHDSLARTDQFEAQLLARIDDAIVRHGIAVPEEERTVLRDGFAQPPIGEVHLAAAGSVR
jgi:putative flavoprotein involved in K+ transport